VYVEPKIKPEEQAYRYSAAELRQDGSQWVGKYKGWLICVADGPRCMDDGFASLTLTSITPNRIEGWTERIANFRDDFDCKKCRWKKPPQKTRIDLVWLPQ
jgi:hypothetical protein